jgi:hypothetical protein
MGSYPSTLIPVYGFLEGDTMGLVILVHSYERIEDFANRLQQAANVRVPKREKVGVKYRNEFLDPKATLKSIGIGPLERLDVVGVA